MAQLTLLKLIIYSEIKIFMNFLRLLSVQTGKNERRKGEREEARRTVSLTGGFFNHRF